MKKLSDGKEETHTFYSGEYEIFLGTDLDEVLSRMREVIAERLSLMEEAEGSGWALLGIVDVKALFFSFTPLKGTNYVELPTWIKNKKAVIYKLNTIDNEYFKWCLTRTLNPIGKDAGRMTNRLREQSKIFDWTGVNFPTTFEDIRRFERNKVGVKLLGVDEDTKDIVHLRSAARYKLTVTLLLYEGHYCVVKNMSRLESKQLSEHEHTVYFCDYRSFKHGKKDVVLKHQLRFGDTSSFLQGSLASHVENLKSVGLDKFRFTREHFTDDAQFNSMFRKGVFPLSGWTVWRSSTRPSCLNKMPSTVI